MKVITGRVLAWSLLVLVFSDAVALSLYSFDYANNVAYLQVNSDLGFNRSIKYLRQDDVLIKVDFSEEKHQRIYQGQTVSWLSYSPEGRHIVFSDKNSIYLYNIDKETNVKTITGTLRKRPYWSQGGGGVAMHAMADKGMEEFLYEIELESETLVSVVFQERQHDDTWVSKGLWGMEWSSSCECFLYEISDSIRSLDHNIVRIKRGELVPVSRRKSLFVSPDKTRYFVQAEYGDGEGELTLRDYQTDKPIAELGWFTSSIHSYDLLWRGNVVRVLGRPSWTVNFENGAFVEGKGELKKMRDVAVDPSGYVLMWHEEQKRFFVQDIETTDIVKTYEAFWLEQSDSGSGDNADNMEATENKSYRKVDEPASANAAEDQSLDKRTGKDNEEARLIQHSLGEEGRIPVGKDTFKAEKVSKSNDQMPPKKPASAAPGELNIKWYIIALVILAFGIVAFIYFRHPNKE